MSRIPTAVPGTPPGVSRLLRGLVFGSLVSAGSTLAASAPAHAQFSDNVVKLGILNGQTGPSADEGGRGSVVAGQIAIDEFGGKINGVPIVLLSADNQNKPDIGLNIAEKWRDVDHIDAYIDVSNSALGLSVQALARAANIPVLFSETLTSKLTGEYCSPMGIQWSFNSHALANMVARAAVREGAKTWFFITTDGEYFHALEQDATAAILAEGGKVVGSIKVPFDIQDASAYLLQARASGANMIGIATPGGDTITLIKQADEYQMREHGQALSGLGISLKAVHSAGLDITKGILVGEAFYWDTKPESRAFAAEFFKRFGQMPTEYQGSVYSSVRQYLTAVKQLNTDNGPAVMKLLHEMPVSDAFASNGHVRVDGQMVHDMYLFRVKSPEESKGDWDIYKTVRTVPGDEAFQSLEQSGCPLAKR